MKKKNDDEDKFTEEENEKLQELAEILAEAILWEHRRKHGLPDDAPVYFDFED